MADKAYDGIREFSIVSADKTLLRSDSGKVFGIDTDAKTMTLPSVAAHPAGLEYTFVNIAGDGVAIMTISPNALDYIAGTATLAASVVDLGVTVDKAIINTKATSITGDTVTIVSDGVDGWYVTSISGIWASE